MHRANLITQCATSVPHFFDYNGKEEGQRKENAFFIIIFNADCLHPLRMILNAFLFLFFRETSN